MSNIENKPIYDALGLNEQDYLPLNSRQMLKTLPEAKGIEDEIYLIMFEPYERRAIYNNLLANQWAMGFVPMIHYQSLNSKTCPVIANILISKIVGNISIEGENDEDVSNVKDAIIDFSNSIMKMESDVLARGEAVVSTNLVEEDSGNKMTIDVYPLGRYIIKREVNGEIYEAFLFKNMFEGEDSYSSFLFLEHRFYKMRDGVKTPYVEYNVVKNIWGSQIGLLKKEVKRYKLEVDNIPSKIKEQIGDIEINKPKAINSLGVYRFKNTAVNKLARYTDIGESQFINATGFMMALENSMTYQEIDKYIGRGRVLLPRYNQVNNGLLKRNKVTQLDYSFMTPFQDETNNIDKKAPIDKVQFDLRADQWKLSLEEAEAKVCIRCGLSILDFDPTLIGGAQRTATEVDYLSDITANTVKEKRALLKDELNKMLNDIATELGFTETRLFVVFDPSSIINKVQNQSLVMQQYQAGLISLKTAIKSIHTDWSEVEVDAEIERINDERDSSATNGAFDSMFGGSN